MRAVAADFARAQMEQSARDRVEDRLRDIRVLPQQRKRLIENSDGTTTVEVYGPFVEEPRIERTPAKQRAVDAELQRLKAVLKRPSHKPSKHPHLDRAILAAVGRGELPSSVISSAVAAFRVAHPETERTDQELHKQFFSRLKKNRRNNRA